MGITSTMSAFLFCGPSPVPFWFPSPFTEGNYKANALVSPLILQVYTPSPVQAIQKSFSIPPKIHALHKHFHIT
jgi:hypothetical protein